MEEHKNIEESNYSEQYKVKRTIVNLIDVETGEFVNANDILNDESHNDKAVFAKMREVLTLAQKTGVYKYICAICNQPVRLNSRQYQDCGHVSNFFSHFSYSDDCPAKSSSIGSIITQTNTLIGNFKRSSIHEDMYKKLLSFLEGSSCISDLRSKLTLDISNNSGNCIPEIEFIYKGRTKVGIDFQLYTTFMSKILEKSFKAQKQKRCSMWIFPFFSPSQQDICAKDIYYGNRRNVFVFDSKEYYTSNVSRLESFMAMTPEFSGYLPAQEESLNANNLKLNCFWQVPVIQDGKLKIGWENKLVTLDELTFDEATGDIFYHDCDKDFNDIMDADRRELLSKWKEEANKRWQKLEEIIAATEEKQLSDSLRLTGQKKIMSIMSRIAQGEVITPFKDEVSGNYGYKLGETVIIKPNFYKVGNFDSNNIAVVQKSKSGKISAIDISGKNVINSKYLFLKHLVKDLYVFRKDRLYGILSIDRGEIIEPSFLGLTLLSEDRILVCTGEYRYNKPVNKRYCICDLEGTEISRKYKFLKHLGNEYIYAERCNGKRLILDVDGYTVYSDVNIDLTSSEIKTNAIEEDLVFISYNNPDTRGYKSAICTLNGETIYGSSIYDKVLPFNDTAYEAYIGKMRGLISKTDGSTLVSENYTYDNGYVKEWTIGWTLYDNNRVQIASDCAQISKTEKDTFIIEDFHGRYRVIDGKGNIIIKPNYSYISYLTHDRILVRDAKSTSRHLLGVINEKEEIVVPIKFGRITLEDEIFMVTIGNHAGLFSYDGEILGDNISSVSDTHMKISHLGKWAFTDIEGRRLTDFIFSNIQPIAKNSYLVSTVYWAGVMDSSLNITFKRGNSCIELMPDNNLRVSTCKGDNQKVSCFGIYDITGKAIIETGLYDNIEWKGNAYMVETAGLKGTINSNGDPIPSSIEPLNEHYSVGHFINKKALLDNNGKALTDYVYDSIICKNNTIEVILKPHHYRLNEKYEKAPLVYSTQGYDIEQYENTYTIRDHDNSILHQGEYKEFIIDDAPNYIVRDSNNNYGVIDVKGDFLVPAKYTNISRINDMRFSCIETVTKTIMHRYYLNQKTYNNEVKIQVSPEEQFSPFKENKEYDGTIVNITDFGLFVKVNNVGTALLHISVLKKHNKDIKQFSKGENIRIKINKINRTTNKVSAELVLR